MTHPVVQQSLDKIESELEIDMAVEQARAVLRDIEKNGISEHAYHLRKDLNAKRAQRYTNLRQPNPLEGEAANFELEYKAQQDRAMKARMVLDEHAPMAVAYRAPGQPKDHGDLLKDSLDQIKRRRKVPI